MIKKIISKLKINNSKIDCKLQIANCKLLLLLLILLLSSIFYLPYSIPSAHAAMVINSPSISNKLTSGLVGWWTFDGNDMASGWALDKSGNGNNATTTGSSRTTGVSGQGMGLNLFNSFAPTNGLTIWLNMDQNQISSNVMTDLASGSHNATLAGSTPSSNVTGVIGQGISFNGSDQYLELANPSTVNLNANFTFAAWIKKPSGLVQRGLFVKMESAGWSAGGKTIYIDDSGQRLSYNVYGQQENFSNAVISDNVWTHVAVVVRPGGSGNNDIDFYINGTEGSSESDAVTSSADTAVDPVLRVSKVFDGQMDDLRLYNRALTASEIAAIYSIPPTTVLSPSPLSSNIDSFSAITIGTWVKYASSTGAQTLMRKADLPSGANSYELKSNGSNFQFTIGTSTSVTTLTGTTPIAPGKWYYLSGVYDGSNMRLYVNGREEASALNGTSGTIETGTSNNWGNSLFFGSNDQPFNFFKGTLDDTRIYNRALSANEIYSLYRLGGATAETNSSQARKLSALDKDTSLVGWWTMDAKDVSGTTLYDRSPGVTKYHGTITGTSKGVGKIGQALKFISANDYVSVPANSSLEGTVEYTISAWIRQTAGSTGGNPDEVFSQTDTAGDHTIALDLRETTCVARLNTYEVTYGQVEGTTNLCDNRWHHITGVKSGTTGRIYVDGVEQNTGTVKNAISTTVAYIGKDHTAPTYFFNGFIDDLRVYTRALTADEVRTLYNQAGKEKLTQNVNIGKDKLTNGLVRYWTFDGKDMTNTLVLDKSGSNINATLTGTSRTPGKIGQALKFNGSEYATPSSGLTTDGTAVTYVGWMKRDSLTSDGAVYWGKNALFRALNSTGFQIRLDKTCPTASAVIASSTTNSILKGQWYHVAGTWDASTDSLKMYINGQLHDSVTTTCNTFSDYTANASYNKIGTGFIGAIDDFRVYNRALSATEIQQLYQYGK